MTLTPNAGPLSNERRGHLGVLRLQRPDLRLEPRHRVRGCRSFIAWRVARGHRFRHRVSRDLQPLSDRAHRLAFAEVQMPDKCPVFQSDHLPILVKWLTFQAALWLSFGTASTCPTCPQEAATPSGHLHRRTRHRPSPATRLSPVIPFQYEAQQDVRHTVSLYADRPRTLLTP